MSDTQWFTFGEQKDINDVEGIALGSDACAEHEWGTDPLLRSFGVDVGKDGVERQQIRELPKDLVFVERSGMSAIFFEPVYGGENPRDVFDLRMKDSLRYNAKYDKSLVAAWDEKSFGVVAHGPKDSNDRIRLKKLWDAFQRKDVAFWTNIGVFHIGGGLIFAIVSKLRDEDKKSLLDQDLDNRRLIFAAAATGIEKALHDAGKRFYALSPKWAHSIRSTKRGPVDTKHEVVFWLNPMEQDKNNYGWFTVEDLQRWTKDDGPIPIKGSR
jgi:hypothetical protein